MGLDLEMLYNAFLIQKTPKMWEEKAYPCLKPLASWFKDLTKRVKFMRSWLAEGPRPSYWISAFFFP